VGGTNAGVAAERGLPSGGRARSLVGLGMTTGQEGQRDGNDADAENPQITQIDAERICAICGSGRKSRRAGGLNKQVHGDVEERGQLFCVSFADGAPAAEYFRDPAFRT
jgi:hypothetical protein